MVPSDRLSQSGPVGTTGILSAAQFPLLAEHAVPEFVVEETWEGSGKVRRCIGQNEEARLVAS